MDQARSTHDTKDQQDRPDAGHQRWTPLAAELRRLRAEAGDPSFQTIAALVRERRLAAGASPGEARVARSTVYDCFRDGRTRMSLPLVREIALALGVPPDGVDGWIAAARVPPPVVPADGVATDAATTDAATDATTEEATDVPVPDAAPRTVPDPEPVHPSSPEHAPAATAGTTGPGPGPRALLVLGCVVLNLMGLAFVSVTAAPFFLDMTGTAIAAIALGPWWGALVGLLSSVVGLGSLAPGELAFTVVNVVGALLWGYGVRSWGLGRTLPRFLALNLGVGIVCTVLSVPILLAVAGAGPRGPEDHLAVTLAASLGTYVAGLVAANLVSSLVDKTVTGFVALVAVSVLPEPWRRGCGLAVADGGRPRHEDEPGGRVTPAGVHPAGGP